MLKKLFNSLIFWTIPFTIVLIFLLPFNFKKYEVEFIRNQGYKDNRVFKEDLNNDGSLETLIYGIAEEFGRVRYETSEGTSQVNITKKQLHSGLVFEDYNNNGQKEFYLLTMSNDSVFISAWECNQQLVPVFEEIFVDVVSKNHTGGYDILGNLFESFIDVNGDGEKEIFFNLEAPYSYQPRKIYRYNVTSNELISSPASGAFHSFINSYDFDNNGEMEFYYGSWAPSNITEELEDIPYPDTVAWMGLLTEDLEYVFPPVKFSYAGSVTNVQPLKTENGTFIAVYCWNYSKEINHKLCLYDIKGHLIKEKSLDYKKYPKAYLWLTASGDYNNVAIYDEQGKLYIFNDQLEIVEEKQLVDVKHTPGVGQQRYDIDKDGEYEYIIRSFDKLIIYRNDLTHPTELLFKNHDFRDISSYIENGVNYIHFRGTDDTVHTVSYMPSIIYPWRFIFYIAVYLILFASLYLIRFIWTRKLKMDNIKLNETVEQRTAEIQSQASALQQTNEKIQELHHFKQRLTGMIAHDLKNPLSYIISTSGNESASAAARRMLTLIENMLDVSKYSESKLVIKPVTVNLKQMVTSVYQQCAYMFTEKNLDFISDINETFYLNCDKDVTERILLNFFTNAVKFTPVNGKITVSAFEEKDNYIRIEVADTGSGIPAGMEELIFFPYKQVEARKAGEAGSTGLGLAFNKLAVEAHTGKIFVKNRDGAVFSFSLKAALKTDFETKQEISKPISHKIQHQLTKTDLKSLETSIADLKKLSVYQISEIQKVLQHIEDKNEAISAWKQNILIVADDCNQQEYEKALSFKE